MAYSLLPEVVTFGVVPYTYTSGSSSATLNSLTESSVEAIAEALNIEGFEFSMQEINLNGYTQIFISPTSGGTSYRKDVSSDLYLPVLIWSKAPSLAFYFIVGTNSSGKARSTSLAVLDLDNQTALYNITFEYDYAFNDIFCYKINKELTIITAGTANVGYMGGIIFTPDYLIWTGHLNGGNSGNYNINFLKLADNTLYTNDFYVARNSLSQIVLEDLFIDGLPYEKLDGLYVKIRGNNDDTCIFTKDGISYLVLGKGSGSNQRSIVVISSEVLGT